MEEEESRKRSKMRVKGKRKTDRVEKMRKKGEENKKRKREVSYMGMT